MSELAADSLSTLSAGQADARSSHDHESIAVRAAQLALLGAEASRGVVAAVLGVATAGYVAWDFAAPWQLAAWGIGVGVAAIARLAFSRHMSTSAAADLYRALHVHVLLMLAAGVAIGVGPALPFAHLPLERQALLTMLSMCWVAAAVPVAAGCARAFHAYALSILVPLALMWTASGALDHLAAGALVIIFAIVLIRLARESERSTRASLEIRRDNARLTEGLARERQEAGLARQAAHNAERAKSRFLNLASHDLRQPLHALSLYSAAIELRRLEGDIGEIGHNIKQAVASLCALVDSLLDISRLDAGTVQPKIQRIELRSFLEEIASAMQPAARHRGLDLQSSICDASVDSDPVLLERLVRNLVDNAIKYTAHGSVAVCAEIDDGDVRIAVRDTGPGIPAEERGRIFEEFYQIGSPQRDRAQGLGVGLAIVRRLAALLKVRVELESRSGAGSTFAVRLAPSRGARQAVLAQVPIENRSLAGVEILIVDDEPAVRDSMCSLLESWGCRAQACSGLAEAKVALRDRPRTLDIILSDLRLRDPESGIDTVRELQAMVGAVPALLISGETAPRWLCDVQASGLPLLHKPVPAEKLRQAVLALLR